MSVPHREGFDDLAPLSNVVGDLIHGYDALVGNLPHVADKVIEMHSATENMAKQLEERMRYLVDGYEYLDSISTQIPEGLRNTAGAHKKSLLEASQVLTDNEKVGTQANNVEIERLKAELHSIAHERVVVEVLTRQAAARPTRTPNASTIQARPQRSSGISRRSSAPLTADGANKQVNGGVFQPIQVPAYFPGAGAALTTDTQNNDPNKEVIGNTSTSTTAKVLSRKPPALKAKAVGDGLMVPAMRPGSIPDELLGLKTVPTMVAGSSNLPSSAPKKKNRASLRDALALDMIGRELRAEVDRTQTELKSLKSQLANAGARNEKEKKMSRQQLELLAKAIRDQENKVAEAAARAAAAATDMRLHEDGRQSDVRDGDGYDDIARLLVQSRLPYAFAGVASQPSHTNAPVALASAPAGGSGDTHATPPNRVVLVDPSLLAGYKVLTVGGGKAKGSNEKTPVRAAQGATQAPEGTTGKEKKLDSESILFVDAAGTPWTQSADPSKLSVPGLGSAAEPPTRLDAFLPRLAVGGGGEVIEVIGERRDAAPNNFAVPTTTESTCPAIHSKITRVNSHGTPLEPKETDTKGFASQNAAVTAGSGVPTSAPGPIVSDTGAGTVVSNMGGVTKIVVETSGLERPNGVEKELLQLLHTVVQSQQETLQGNQALLMNLLKERERDVAEVGDDEGEAVDGTQQLIDAAATPIVSQTPPASAPAQTPDQEQAPTAVNKQSVPQAQVTEDREQRRENVLAAPNNEEEEPQRLFRTQFGRTFLVTKYGKVPGNSQPTDDSSGGPDNQPGILAAKQQLPVRAIITTGNGHQRAVDYGGAAAAAVSATGSIPVGFNPQRGAKPVLPSTLETMGSIRDRVNMDHNQWRRTTAARNEHVSYPERAQTLMAGTQPVQAPPPSAAEIAMNLASAIGNLVGGGTRAARDSHDPDARSVTRRDITTAVEEGVRKAIQIVNEEGLREAQRAFVDRNGTSEASMTRRRNDRPVDFEHTSGPTGLFHAGGAKSKDSKKGVEGEIIQDILGSRRAVSEMRTLQRTGDDSLSISGDRGGHFWVCENHDNLHADYPRRRHSRDDDSDSDDMVDVFDHERGNVIGRNGDILSDDEYDQYALNTGFRFKRGTLLPDDNDSAADAGEYTHGVNYGSYFGPTRSRGAGRDGGADKESWPSARVPREREVPLSIPRPRESSIERSQSGTGQRRRPPPGPVEGENWHDGDRDDDDDSIGSGKIKYRGVGHQSASSHRRELSINDVRRDREEDPKTIVAALRPPQLISKVLEYENTEIVQGIEDASLLGSEIYEDEDEAIAPTSLLSRRDRLRLSSHQAPSLSTRSRYDASYDYEEGAGAGGGLRVRSPRPMDPHYIARHGEELIGWKEPSSSSSSRPYSEKAHLHKNTPGVYDNRTDIYKHTAYPYGAYEYFYEDSDGGRDDDRPRGRRRPVAVGGGRSSSERLPDTDEEENARELRKSQDRLRAYSSAVNNEATNKAGGADGAAGAADRREGNIRKAMFRNGEMLGFAVSETEEGQADSDPGYFIERRSGGSWGLDRDWDALPGRGRRPSAHATSSSKHRKSETPAAAAVDDALDFDDPDRSFYSRSYSSSSSTSSSYSSASSSSYVDVLAASPADGSGDGEKKSSDEKSQHEGVPRSSATVADKAGASDCFEEDEDVVHTAAAQRVRESSRVDSDVDSDDDDIKNLLNAAQGGGDFASGHVLRLRRFP